MKTKFFGISAKLALAILAVSGSLFTSCYDSVDSDMSVPYTPPAAKYFLSGTITDAATGLPLAATVNGTTLGTDGTYFITAQAGANTLTVTKSGYADVTRTVTIPTVEAGQSITYVANVAMVSTATPPFDADDVTINISSKTTWIDNILTKADDESLNISTGDQAENFDRTFMVDAGITSDIETALADAPADLARYIKNYLGTQFGTFGEYQDNALPMPFTISLPAYAILDNVTVRYYYVKTLATFVYDGATYKVNIAGIDTYSFSRKYTIDSHSHSHNGHGHGDAINAGGGIVTPEL